MNEIVQLADPHVVNAVLDRREKAVTMEEHMQRAGNFEKERDAARERVRAERFIGLELRKIHPASIGRKKIISTEVEKLPEWYHRISKDQRSWWQLIALIPEKKFNEYLVDPGKGALEKSKRMESGIPTTKGFVKLALAYKPKPKERPEKSADQLAQIEEKKRLAAQRDLQQRTKQANARTEQSSQRFLERTFTFIKKMTPHERKSLLQMIEDRADELLEDSTWAAAS
jgi:hypothetical protein